MNESRDVMIRRVVKSLARLRAHGIELPVHNERGAAPIHVALPTDLVGEVEKRVAVLGGANVVLAYPDRFMVIGWDLEVVKDIDTVRIHENSTMDMLRLWIERSEGPANVEMVRDATVQIEMNELQYQF